MLALLAAGSGGSGSSAGGSSSLVWAAPALSFVGVVVGAAYTSWRTTKRERLGRRNQAQRTALYELQDAAWHLRQALRDYGAAAAANAGSVSDGLTTAVDDATNRLTMIKVRVNEEVVRNKVETWTTRAQAYFTGDDAVTLSEQEKAWTLLHESVGAVLGDLD